MKLKSIRAIARALEVARVRCLFAGGLAVVAHGYPIDIFVEEPFSFDEVYAKARCEEVGTGLTMRFVDLRTLIAMKERAGRPKDVDDIAHLRLLEADEQV